MKTATESTSKMIANHFNFDFEFTSNQDPSLKAWEEENAEYASWNLIIDKQEAVTC